MLFIACDRLDLFLVYVQDSRTALHEACRSQSSDEEGLFKISQLLIEAGSDINSKSSDVGEVRTSRVIVLMQFPFPIVTLIFQCLLPKSFMLFEK